MTAIGLVGLRSMGAPLAADSMPGRAEEMGYAHRDIAGRLEVLGRPASSTPGAGSKAA